MDIVFEVDEMTRNLKIEYDGKSLGYENLCRKNQLSAFKHHGFWQCMDTKRDKENLEHILKKRKPLR